MNIDFEINATTNTSLVRVTADVLDGGWFRSEGQTSSRSLNKAIKIRFNRLRSASATKDSNFDLAVGLGTRRALFVRIL